jgi:hypothetical protein
MLQFLELMEFHILLGLLDQQKSSFLTFPIQDKEGVRNFSHHLLLLQLLEHAYLIDFLAELLIYSSL